LTYAELLAYLERHWIKVAASGIAADYPFDELRALLAARGDPQRGLRLVHVTGSKGKGSIVAMTAALMRAHGQPTGAFVSPHLERFEERVLLGDGRPMPPEELAGRMGQLIELSARLGAEPRQVLRLLLVGALEAWRERGTRLAVVEVSVGGRYDFTNVLDGQVAAVAPIGLEHTQRLGPTRAAIAAQKVGIVKPGSLCVSAAQPPEVEAVLRAGVALAGGRLIEVGPVRRGAAGYEVRRLDRSGADVDLWTPHRCFEGLRLGLLGRHQAENAAVALCAAEALMADLGERLEPARVAAALAGVRWPGRLEPLADDPLVVYDGAHTPESAAVLAQALGEHFPGTDWTFVVGMLTRRDAVAMLRELARVAERIILVPVPGFDAFPPVEIAARAAEAGIPAEPAASVADALARASGAPICVTGTLYLYEETRRALVPTPSGRGLG
jgi:dihydrofolate synthase/folylpolyglutamate synthase